VKVYILIEREAWAPDILLGVCETEELARKMQIEYTAALAEDKTPDKYIVIRPMTLIKE